MRQADMTPFGTTVLKSVFFAAALNSVIGFIGGYGLGFQLYLGDAVRLLSGTAAAISIPDARYHWLNEHPLPVLSYFLATHALAFAAAILRKHAVHRWELDRPTSKLHRYFQRRAPWYYLFGGIDHKEGVKTFGVIIGAFVSVNGMTNLYTGLLEDYEVNDNGQLDRIILSGVKRCSVEADDSPPCKSEREDPLLISPLDSAAVKECLLSSRL